MTKRKLARWSRPLTVIAAMLITTVSVWLLGVLNVRATSGLQPRQRIRTVIVRGPESQVTKEKERKNEEPQPEPPDEEIMEVNLDVPLEPMPLEPLELEIALPSPTIPPIQVEVTSPTADASPTAPQANSKKTDVYSASKVDQPPREYRSNRRPPYPAAKLQSGVEGQVTLKLLIDEAGEVKDVKVVAGEPAFVEAVMAVVFDWRFTPAQNRGRPVKVWGLKRVNFRIR